MSLPKSLQSLQALPLRAIDDQSPFPQGRFIVSAPTSKDEKKPLVIGEGSDAAGKTWFKTTPLNKAAVEALQSLGGDILAGRHDLLGLLEVENCIGARVCARYTGWELYGRAACLVLDMGTPTIIDTPPSYAQIFENTIALQQILNSVNSKNEAYAPKTKAAWDKAETFAGNEKRPLRVLALEVMDRAALNKKPCEVFDIIGGTSTGGLIAIMLGRLKMTVQECLDAYDSVMKDVFGSGWLRTHIGKPLDYLTKGEFYSAEQLEKVIKDLLRKRLPTGQNAEDAALLDDASPCKILLMATREESASNRGPVFLRSYANEQTAPDPDLSKIKLWEAARATSAAPGYFQPTQVGRVKLVDGGLLANNPLGWLWTEILSVYGPTRETDCFLSIGTGMGANAAVAQPGLDFKKAMLSFANIATNTESTNLLFRALVDAFAPHAQTKKYYRLNVSKELAEPKDTERILGWLVGDKNLKGVLNNFEDPGSLDDVDAILKLKEWTTEWIKAQQEIIKSCSEALARNL
ncbi:hypothetical protein PENANT_c075G09643 [Penicillium antarcticum]|uniref:PNPLA domain-containing protein n=2 Tax=Penicillium antarcticum TaxID=416450 RepID=A0A1V6PQ93_9EURO|nr:hypothetical protein PENANT_c075G09643 [Penicillium antarcticum]